MKPELVELLEESTLMLQVTIEDSYPEEKYPAGKYWFRYDDVNYAPPYDDMVGEFVGSGTSAIRLWAVKVIKTTPKGVWLNVFGISGAHSDRGKFVLFDSHKRWACPTRKEAMESFYKRKEKQASIYYHRMIAAERFRDRAKMMLDKASW